MRRSLFVVCAALACLVAPASADEGRPIVAIEASSHVVREGRDLSSELKGLVQREVESLDFRGAPRASRYVLSASLVGLETAAEAGKVRSTARVSVVLREAKRGAVHAVLQGKATAEDGPRASAAAENDALVAAVRGAVKPVPEAVKQAR